MTLSKVFTMSENQLKVSHHNFLVRTEPIRTFSKYNTIHCWDDDKAENSKTVMAPFVPESSFQLIWDNGFGSKRQLASSLRSWRRRQQQPPHRKSKMSGYCSCHYCFRFGVAFSAAALPSLRSIAWFQGAIRRHYYSRTKTRTERTEPRTVPLYTTTPASFCFQSQKRKSRRPPFLEALCWLPCLEVSSPHKSWWHFPMSLPLDTMCFSTLKLTQRSNSKKKFPDSPMTGQLGQGLKEEIGFVRLTRQDSLG